MTPARFPPFAVIDPAGLRDLRAWHWQEVLTYRSQEQRATRKGHLGAATHLERQVGVHLRFVQTLNDFFDDEGPA